MNGERLHRHICLEYHKKPSLGRMSKGVFHCKIWEKANRRIIIRLVPLPGERMSITLSPGGKSLGELGTGDSYKSHLTRLSSYDFVCPNPAFLKYGWIHLFADPSLPIVGCLHLSYYHIHSPTPFFTTSMPSFRPSTDLITVLSSFLPLLTQSLLYSQTSPFYRSIIPRYKFHIFTCSYLSILF